MFLVQAMADRFNAPVVFCHNDLLSGNLMHNEDKGNMPCITLQNLLNFFFLFCWLAGFLHTGL